ncbi:PAS domain S-box-containing protein [Clostridium sp. USBA 49]|jgi:PAS domain S-box-containing protein|uniref:PAS domain-containing sensor histidine kinase n=1 Tax=Clostridium sp. USBA 49 TaxID=1881060 RepID=UPI0009C7682E|nr:PAS domain-containing sensor histidine kinase [Clostridium sp. USBA 49]SKA72770.1 PAS domain S-box-containing protein [Clostridium sp. USBA 49]
MFQLFENIPFGVIILKKDLLTIEYFNFRAKIMLDLEESILYKNIEILPFFNILNNILLNCTKDEEQKLKEVELVSNRFFTLIICPKNSFIEIYIIETTDEVLKNREKIKKSIVKLKKEKEKLLNISTELKTKCDIIEILRDREKQHLMHLRDVINNISEGLIVIDNKGILSLCNRAVYKIINLKIGEKITKNVILDKYDIFTVNENEQTVDYMYNKLYKKNIPIKNFVIKFLDKISGEIKYIEINSNPIINKNSELVYTIITIKDITETKIHQIKVEEQSNFIKDVVNNLDVPIAVLDYPKLEYRLVNKKHKDILNIINKNYNEYKNNKNENINKLDIKILNEDIYNIICKVGEKGKEYCLSPYSIIDSNGNERFYKIKFIPYKDNNNLVKRIHIHGLDVTDEVNHNLELEKITKLKDEFFTVISHELRTPLTIIYSSLQLAYDIYKKDITPNIDKILKRINQNCSRLLKLINNILDISKAEAGFLTLNCSYFDIVYTTELIISSVNLYAKNKEINLIFDTNEEECRVFLDKDKYERILLNLLSNSIKFTPDGKQILVTLFVEEDYVTLSVKDEGIGIPENKIDSIFDRYSQINTSLSRRAEGTGIGLSLVKKLTESMNAQIEVISEEGVGSEFLVKFNKESLCLNSNSNIVIMDTTINDKIDIEFSDIN